MSRKDYIALAKVLSVVFDRYNREDTRNEYQAVYEVYSGISDYLYEDNENFDRSRFAFACAPIPDCARSDSARIESNADLFARE